MSRAARLFTQAFSLAIATPRKRRPLLALQTLEARETPTVAGTAYVDLNQNGVQDSGEAGIPGVVVTATLPDNTTETATTDSSGAYSLTTNNATVRLQFSAIPEGLIVGKANATTGATVRFLDASANPAGVDLGLNSYLVVTNTYFYDKATTGIAAGEGAIIAVQYGADGVQTPTVLATNDQVGSTFGLAYQPQTNSIYASSFVKRHAGMGPDTLDPAATTVGTTTGGIYRIDRTNSNAVSILINLNSVPAGVIPSGSTGASFATGADPHPSAADIDGGDWLHDSATVPTVGKRGLGGLAVSADGRTLYTINLATRELIEIPVAADGTLDTSKKLRRTAIPLTNPGGITSFNAADLRPFAVTVRGNAVFVGVTYTAQTQGGAGGAANLRAIVYAFDPATGTFKSYNGTTNAFATGTTPVISVPLNYARGFIDAGDPANNADNASGNWLAWTDTFTNQSSTVVGDVYSKPMPWLTDIAFDGTSMVLGLRDRFGDMGGYQTYSTDTNATDPINTVAGGDILRASLATNGAWTLESNGASGGATTGGAGNTQGPGGGEFYYQDELTNVSQEVMTGGLAMVPGLKTLVATGINVQDAASGGIYTLSNSDTNPSPTVNTAGTTVARAQTYLTSDFSTFGSANGVGNAEIIPADAGIQVGDLVFDDANNNGIQDAGEAGIAGVVLNLFKGSTSAGTVTTDANGNFLFDGLDPATSYQIRIDTTQSALTGKNLAKATQGTNTGVDSGGTFASSTVTLAFTTGAAGTSDHTLDIGFTSAVNGVLTLGNQVFNDANNNGLLDSGETGISGVAVDLLNSTNAVVASTSTGANGVYTFTSLAAGTYRVRIAAANFNTGAVLAGFVSSAGTNGAFETNNPPSADGNVNNDDNGVTDTTAGALGSGGFIQSGPITLSVGGEPVNDGDTDANTNLTLDFGVRQPVVANTLTLGNQVFVDTNNNGLLDSGETGLAGVTVQLINSSNAVVASATTGANGIYTFANLAAGSYRVRIAASNFNTGAILAGHTSSTGTNGAYETTNPPSPDGNVNNDDNGITNTTAGALGSGGFIQSNAIALTVGGEPIDDGDTDANTNLTLDFGLVPPAPAGVLTLGDTVFEDANNNGLRDSGETGIANVTVQLLNSGGTVIRTATTDADGLYLFTGLAAGNYRVRLPAANFTTTGTPGALAGFTSSTGTNGSATGTFEGTTPVDPSNNTDDDDNGVIIATAGPLGSGGFIQSGTIALAAGATNDNATLDFGVFRKFSLGNQVFNDANNNGLRDTGETGISGVTVNLLSAAIGNALIATTTTNSTGQYLFTNLIAGDYIVEVAAANFNTGGKLFSYQSSTGGTGTPFEGANTPDPAASNTDGDDNGTTAGTLGSGGSIQSLPVTLGPTANAPTGETPANDSSTPDAQSNLTVDFGVFQQTPANSSLSGRVFLDYNNDGVFNGPDTGIAGVTVSLTGGALASALTVTTDASGNYSFTNISSGTYTITETQPTTPVNQTGKSKAGTAGGNIGTANVISNIVLGVNKQATGYTFGEVPVVSLGGAVYEDANGNGLKDTGETGIAGVTVTLTGSNVVSGAITPVTATTDADGNYTFDTLLPGTYTIAETQPTGYLDGKEQNGTPAAASIPNDRFVGINLTTTSAAATGFNFGEIKSGSLAGVVFADTNNNGAQDTGETGIAGVLIKLTGTSGGAAVSRSATTATDGTYTFADLGPGTYTLTETQPAKYADGINTPGTASATASANKFTGIALTSGTAATGYLFGEQTAPDLVITQTQTPSRPAPGSLVTLTYTVTNNGTASATAATSNINLAGLTFVSSTGTGFDSATKVWTIGDVAVAATQTMTITARVPQTPGRYRPSASVSATNTETSTANNSASTLVSSGLGITMQSFLSSLFSINRRRPV